jgi:hypothetical protein
MSDLLLLRGLASVLAGIGQRRRRRRRRGMGERERAAARLQPEHARLPCGRPLLARALTGAELVRAARHARCKSALAGQSQQGTPGQRAAVRASAKAGAWTHELDPGSLQSLRCMRERLTHARACWSATCERGACHRQGPGASEQAGQTAPPHAEQPRRAAALGKGRGLHALFAGRPRHRRWGGHAHSSLLRAPRTRSVQLITTARRADRSALLPESVWCAEERRARAGSAP